MLQKKGLRLAAHARRSTGRLLHKLNILYIYTQQTLRHPLIKNQPKEIQN